MLAFLLRSMTRRCSGHGSETAMEVPQGRSSADIKTTEIGARAQTRVPIGNAQVRRRSNRKVFIRFWNNAQLENSDVSNPDTTALCGLKCAGTYGLARH